MSGIVRSGHAYVVATTWNLWIGQLHRVWVAESEQGVENDSCSLWGWDWWWQK